MADNLWFVVVALGPIVLGGAIVFAVTRRRKLSAQEKQAREGANQELYDRPASRSHPR